MMVSSKLLHQGPASCIVFSMDDTFTRCLVSPLGAIWTVDRDAQGPVVPQSSDTMKSLNRVITGEIYIPLRLPNTESQPQLHVQGHGHTQLPDCYTLTVFDFQFGKMEKGYSASL